MRARGERESTARIALRRKGAGKKLLRASRLKADEACGVVRGEGGQVIDCEASIDVLNGGDNLLDEE